MSPTRRTTRRTSKPAYVRGELRPDVPNAAVVKGPRGAWEARVYWQFNGLPVTLRWGNLVVHGQGNEVCAFEAVAGVLVGYAQHRNGVERLVLSPSRDRLVVIGSAGVGVFDGRLRSVWEEDVPGREEVEFLRWAGRRFRVRAKNRPGDAWAEYEFHLDAGAMPGRRGPGAQPVV